MKRLLSLALSLTMVSALLCTNAFAIKSVTTFEPEDVLSDEYIEQNKVSSWAVDGVEAARAAGLIPDFTGNPGYQDAITREQFAELAVNFVMKCGITIPPDGESFDDCDNPNVILASGAGIVNGVGNGKFAPKTATNREQIATMLYRAILFVKEQTNTDLTPNAASITGYSDKGDVSSWAIAGVGALASNGIMKGTSSTTLSPKSPCTVEPSILLVYRLYQAYQAG